MNQKMKGIRLGNAAAWGVLVGLGLTITGSITAAWLLYKETVNMDSAGHLVMGIIFLSGIGGGIISVKKAKEKKILVSVIAGLVIYLMLLALGILFFDGSIKGAGETMLLMVGASISAALVGTNRNHKVKRPHHPMRTG